MAFHYLRKEVLGAEDVVNCCERPVCLANESMRGAGRRLGGVQVG